MHKDAFGRAAAPAVKHKRAHSPKPQAREGSPHDKARAAQVTVGPQIEHKMPFVILYLRTQPLVIACMHMELELELELELPAPPCVFLTELELELELEL